MSDIAIRATDLAKRYRIGARRRRHTTLRDALASAASAPFTRLRGAVRRSGLPTTNEETTVWALEGVSFEIKRGEVVGIIGRNGAGKSTLLKILSRITEPTRGQAEIHGRVGSLLEVGTGFHPELTGRENVYLNGAILGMTRAEIVRRFDAIVAFAEVDRFIDTPVKHYSTGMYFRLAFAVAAHLEPEILLVDEVLAVGDAAFQKRCLGKMDEVAASGRTVLFVSHNMGAVRSLCSEGIVLEGGRVVEYGPIARGIEAYYRILTAGDGDDENGRGVSASTAASTHFGPIALLGAGTGTVRQSDGFTVLTTLSLTQSVAGFSIICILENMHGKMVFHLREESTTFGLRNIEAGAYELKVRVPPLWVAPGLYAISFKALLWGDVSSARILSDKYPMDVDGTASGSEAVLQPEVAWSVQSIER